MTNITRQHYANIIDLIGLEDEWDIREINERAIKYEIILADGERVLLNKSAVDPVEYFVPSSSKRLVTKKYDGVMSIESIATGFNGKSIMSLSTPTGKIIKHIENKVSHIFHEGSLVTFNDNNRIQAYITN